MGKTGFLLKEGAKVQSWKKRWFVLENGVVKYYKDEKSTKPIKEFRLMNSELNAPSTMEEARQKARPFIFTITVAHGSGDNAASSSASASSASDKNRVFFLCASSQSEKLDWQTALEVEGAYHAPVDLDRDFIDQYGSISSDVESEPGDDENEFRDHDHQQTTTTTSSSSTATKTATTTTTTTSTQEKKPSSPLLAQNQPQQFPQNTNGFKTDSASTLLAPSSPKPTDSPLGRSQSAPASMFNSDDSANSKKTRWRCMHVFSGHTAAVSALALSKSTPDDPRFKLLFSASADKTVKIWNFDSKTLLSSIKTPKAVSSLAYFEKEKVIFCGSTQDRIIRGWEIGSDIANPVPFVLEGGQHPMTALAACVSKSILASADTRRDIRIWDIAQRKCIGILNGHNAKITALNVLEQDSLLISSSEDGVVKVWDLQKKGECIATLENNGSSVTNLAVGELEKMVFTSSVDNSIKIRDFRNDFFFKDFHCVDGVRFADCSGLCTCEVPQSFPTLEQQAQQLSPQAPGRNRKPVNVIPVSLLTPYPDLSSLTYVIGSSEKNIKLWTLEIMFSAKGKEIELSWDCSLRAHDANITALVGTRSSSLSEARIFTASLDKTIKMWGDVNSNSSSV